MNTSTTFHIRQAIQFLGSLPGVAAILVAVSICFLAFVKPAAMWIAFSLLLFAALVSPAVGGWRTFLVPQHLLMPFERMQDLSRLICAFWLLVLCIATLRPAPTWRRGTVGPGVIVFLITHVLLAFRLLVSDLAQRGVVSFPLLLLITVFFVVGLGRYLQTPQDVRRLLMAVVGMGVMFVFCSLVQYQVVPSSVTWRGRFYGIGSNPQQVGLVMASVTTIAIYFVMRPGEAKWVRVVMIAVIPFMLVVSVWTGSRLSLVAVALGATFMLYNKLGRAIFLLPVLLLFLGVLESIISIDLEVRERLVSTQNTRGWVWAGQFEAFMAHPVFGDVGESWKPGENSWLGMAKVAGVFGLLPLVVAAGLMMKEAFGVWRRRALLGSEAALVEVVIALFAILFFVPLVEAFLLMPLSLAFLILMANLAILRMLHELQNVSLARGEYAR